MRDFAELVHAAFCRHLGVDPGPDGHFFDFGGDSLKAAELMIELSKAAGQDLPFYLLLDSQIGRAHV